jgi:hypothetical protein
VDAIGASAQTSGAEEQDRTRAEASKNPKSRPDRCDAGRLGHAAATGAAVQRNTAVTALDVRVALIRQGFDADLMAAAIRQVMALHMLHGAPPQPCVMWPTCITS